MHGSLSGLIPLYISVFLLALNGLFAKVIPLDATSISQLRSCVAAVALLLLILLQNSNFRLPNLKTRLGIYILGVLLGLHWVTYFHAMQIASVAIGMLSLFSYPVITVFLEAYLEKRSPHWQDIAAGLAMFLGLLIMVYPEVELGQLAVSAQVQGVFWGTASAFFFATRNTAQKHYFASTPSSSLMYHQLIAVILILLPFVSFEKVSAMPSETWGLILLLGIFSTAAAHTLLSAALKHMRAKTVAMIGCTLPVFGSLLAWMVLGERPSNNVVLGGVIIVSISIYESMSHAKQ